MDNKDKTAIENLIIIARYMQDNSILSSQDESLLERSIHRAQRLIGIQVNPSRSEVELGEMTELDIEALIEAVKNRKKS